MRPRLHDVASRVWKSIFRVPWPTTDRERSEVMTESLLLHLHSAKVSARTLRFRTTLGLGWVALVLFGILTITGMLLMIYYVPHPPEAYRSIKDLENAVTFGRFLRNLHRWSAHAMVLVVFLHMCRVFYTGSYKKPREFNWCVGVVLLLLTLGLSFTGYLLPWDQLSFWAITVGTTIASYIPYLGDKMLYLLRGGNVIGEATVIRFYVLHCAVLPALTVSLIAFHLWRLRKDGGLAAPDSDPATAAAQRVESTAGAFPATTKTWGLMALAKGRMPPASREPKDAVFTWPGLLYREILLTLVVVDILCAVSLVFNAPLEEIADATVTPNPAKAPWYFLGLQELVHYSALFGGVIAPTLFVLALLAIPYVDTNPKGAGTWCHASRRLALAGFTVLIVTVAALTIIGTFFRGADWKWVMPW
jgi:quinol-cytochrome oxidoreductase complex cytochrome b subunit